MGYGYGYYNDSTGRNPWRYDVVTEPATTPISVAEAKQWLRIDSSDTSEDDLIAMLISSSAECFESYTGRVLINTTFRTFRDQFYGDMELRRCPLSSVTSIEYRPKNSQTYQTLSIDRYKVERTSGYGHILLFDCENFTFIDTDCDPEAVRITFVAGYGATPADVPADIKQALLMMVAKGYEDRGDCCDSSTAPMQSIRTMKKYKILEFI